MQDDTRYNVPYFCPKCGRDKTNFDSLVALRHHVDVFHFKQQRDPLPRNGYHLIPPMEWANGRQDSVDRHLRPPLEFPVVNYDYARRNQTPWTSQENRVPVGPPANAPSSRPADRGVPDEVSQTLRHLEDLRKSSDKAMSSQREQLKRMEEEVRVKESHLERTRTEVERAINERRNLEKECLEMRKNKMEDQDKLDKILKKIEEQNEVIDKKEKELKKLRDFIRNAAQKETDAKKKLEETVEKILLRAEKAEKELEEMRARSNRLEQQATSAQTSNASASAPQNKDQRTNRADDVRDVLSGTNVAYAAAATHASNVLSSVEALPPEQQNRAAASAIDDIEQQDLSPMAQEYIKNFLAYYRALRRSELAENSPRHNDIAHQPMADGPSSHVIGLRENPAMPERDRRRAFDDPIQPSEYPTFENSPYRYDDPRDGQQRTDLRRYNHQQPHPGGRPSRDDWVMRSEASQMSSRVPLRDGCWTPVGGGGGGTYRDPYSGRCKDDLEIDRRGIVWDRQPPKQYLEVDERPVKGSRRKRRPKTDPGYAARHHAKDRDVATGHPSTAVYPGMVTSPSVTRAAPIQTSRRREGEGRLDKDSYRDPGAGQRSQERIRLGESLERGPDASDTLTEVTRDSDYDAGSLALPERDWSLEGRPRQLGEGSTGDSADGRPVEEDEDEEEEVEDEEEVTTPDDSIPSREVTDGGSDAKTPTPVPLPRSSPVQKPETATAAEEEEDEDEDDDLEDPVISAEVLGLVLPHLDTLSLCQAALVSREWRDVSRKPDVWQNVTIKNAQISSKFLVTQSKWCSKVKTISLEGVRGRSRKPDESDDVYAKKTRGCLETGFDALLSASQDSLVAIFVIDCSNVLTERCLWQVSCYCRLLQDMTYISDLDPAGPEVMWALGAGCRDVRHVRIPPKFPCQKPDRFNNKCVQVIGRCWPLLLTLSLGGVEVDIKGLAIIAQCCLKLESIELDHMCEVTEDMAIVLCQHGLKGLQRLRLNHTPATPKAIIHFHSACPHLKSITVETGISDYFGDPDNQKNRGDYEEIIDTLTKLKSVPGLDNVFHLETV